MKLSPARSTGFTLIELLIVIALLGALAVGLLATIDPFEQLKKGRDTSQRNTTSEFYNANLRYYSTKAQFPWGTAVQNMTPVNTMSAEISQLVAAGELKNKFMDLAGTGNLAKIYISSTSPEQMAVCFKPESKGFQNDANTIYAQDGGTGSNCKANATGEALKTASDCYYCIQ